MSDNSQLSTIIEMLTEIKPGVDYSANKELVTSGVLDSLSLLTLCVQLADEFDVEITPVDILPENFSSAESISEMITKLSDED